MQHEQNETQLLSYSQIKTIVSLCADSKISSNLHFFQEQATKLEIQKTEINQLKQDLKGIVWKSDNAGLYTYTRDTRVLLY